MKTEKWPSLIQSVMKHYYLQNCVPFLCFLLVLFKLMGIKVQNILTPFPQFYNFLNCESQHGFFFLTIFSSLLCHSSSESQLESQSLFMSYMKKVRCSHRFCWCSCLQVDEFPSLISEQLPGWGRAT